MQFFHESQEIKEDGPCEKDQTISHSILVPGRLEKHVTDRGAILIRTLEDEAAALELEKVLVHLALHDFPCHRLITRIGQQVVTQFAEGEILSSDCSVPLLASLGELLARLHTLPTSDTLPDAKMLSAGELSFALSCLKEARGARSTPLLEELEAAILSFPSFYTLPLNLLHNDIHPGNVIVKEDELCVIDWEGAGRGPAIVDLGFLLSSIYPKDPDVDLGERVRAVLRGYTSVREIGEDELELLRSAIEFRPLVFLSALELQRTKGEPEDPALSQWFLERYREAPRIANLAYQILGEGERAR